MTVKELVESLSDKNPDALVYTMAHDDDIALAVTALAVTDVKADVLVGKDKTVVLVY